ncbi:uncharacterized protein LOC126797199 [Argentina anserina]|uniref:uncharacterized protein LOC126797199 n=1 Tax=Argentina anserina TaxID=57926 RepID=UPI002176253A|nr:uncharacterized protein LOC126797199 [Potentilla anserina]
MYDLQVRNMRGQGYDGASNKRGIYNGLQALFLEQCIYAYYVHCYAHCLQLTLNATAQGVQEIWQFFITLGLIVNFVDASTKRHSALRAVRKEELWGNFKFGSLWGTSNSSTKQTLNDMMDKGVEGQAEAILKVLSLSELNRRYSEQASELLTLSSSLDPRDDFKYFKIEDVCNLAKRFYLEDFDDGEMCTLELECAYYKKDMRSDLSSRNWNPLPSCATSWFKQGSQNFIT